MSNSDEIAEMLLMEYWAAKWKEVEKLIDEDESSHAQPVFRDMDIDERLLHPVYALDFNTIIRWYDSPQWSTPNEYYTTTCQYLDLLDNPMPGPSNSNAGTVVVVEVNPLIQGHSSFQRPPPPVEVSAEINKSTSSKTTKYRNKSPSKQEDVPSPRAADAISISETANVKHETKDISDPKCPSPSKIDPVEEAVDENVDTKNQRLEKAREATTTLLADTNGKFKVELSFSELELPTPTKTSFTISEGGDAILLPTADRVLVAIPGYLTMDADKLGLMAKADRLPSHITKYLSCPPKINHRSNKSPIDTKISNTAAASSKTLQYTKSELTAKRKLFHSEPPSVPAAIKSKRDIKKVPKKVFPKKNADVLIISTTNVKPGELSTVKYGKIKWSEVVSERSV